jgi:hypothetical protein
MSFNKINFSCAPMFNQSKNNQLMGYLCSSSKNIENFSDTPIQIYDNTKIYRKDDIVVRNGKAYLMIDEAGEPGDDYAPPRENQWTPLDYDNNKVYKKGDVVNGSDGKVYRMIDAIGEAGEDWAPPRPTNWEEQNVQ